MLEIFFKSLQKSFILLCFRTGSIMFVRSKGYYVREVYAKRYRKDNAGALHCLVETLFDVHFIRIVSRITAHSSCFSRFNKMHRKKEVLHVADVFNTGRFKTCQRPTEISNIKGKETRKYKANWLYLCFENVYVRIKNRIQADHFFLSSFFASLDYFSTEEQKIFITASNYIDLKRKKEPYSCIRFFLRVVQYVLTNPLLASTCV